MKPLATNQLVLIWIGACAPGKDISKRKRLAFIAFGLFLCLINIISTISSAIFVWKFVSIDMEASFYVLFHLCGAIACTYMVVVGFIMRSETSATIKRLTEIYNECKFFLFSKFSHNRFRA